MATIVVIEDNPQNARMADKLLRRAGYTVQLAEDGEMGLTTVFEATPDLILIDLGLPDIDGQTVIGLVRQEEALQSVPIIAFTAWPPDEAHDMATRYGCDGVITKPINTRTFADQIGEYLKEASPEPAVVGAVAEVVAPTSEAPTTETATKIEIDDSAPFDMAEADTEIASDAKPSSSTEITPQASASDDEASEQETQNDAASTEDSE